MKRRLREMEVVNEEGKLNLDKAGQRWHNRNRTFAFWGLCPGHLAKSCAVMKTKDEFDAGDSGTWKERINKAVRNLWGASGDVLLVLKGNFR